MSLSRERPTFGLGTTSLGGMFQPMAASQAQALLHAAHDRGIRWFDTAPMYGASTAERRLGQFLDDLGSTDGLAVSTKVGRVLIPRRLAPAAPLNEFGWRNAGPYLEVFDYSYDGIMRSVEDSLARMGREQFDVLFLHDIGRDTHGEDNDRQLGDLRAGGYRALTELKAAGVARELGIGVNEVAALRTALTEMDLDRALLANQFTLLTQPADDAVFTECANAGVKLAAGGIYNSGILAGGEHFGYAAVPAEIASKVRALSQCCQHYGVPLMTAAMQFVLRSGVFDFVLLGVRTVQELDASLDAAEADIPDALWDDLVARDLLAAHWVGPGSSGVAR